MAEAAAITFAINKLSAFLLGTLGDHVTNNMSSNELKSNATWMRDELGYMQSFLSDAERKREADDLVHHWISDVGEIAKKTTFVLEEFSPRINASFRNNGRIGLGTLRSCVYTCRNKSVISDANDQIKELKGNVEDISRRRKRYGIRNLSLDQGQSSASNVKELRRTTPYSDEKLFVGFEDVKKVLLEVLLKEETRRSVVSIHGMGGLGKTALARNLYNSTQVHFKSRAWICVSQEFNIPDLLRSVIKSFQKPRSHDEMMMLEKMEVGDLEGHLHELLRNTRYLVVLDDVWDKEAWRSLKKAFPDCNNGSRVIVTTRNEVVATRIDERIYAHHLRFLNPTESWDLFIGKILHVQEHDNWCSPDMQALGKEMVAKCDGLPLAVVVLGGLLSHKQNLEEWEQVKEHIWGHLANDSIEISHLLSLSYHHLPSQLLKDCFLYLGTFPEDYLIDATHLTYLWMGEQFITLGEEEMEHVAERSLNELINRSLIQVARRRWDKIVECRIHDLLRDLAIKKAYEENFFHIYKPSTNHSSLVQQKRNVVHIQIQRYFSEDHSNKRLQSLIVRNIDKWAPESFDILKKFNNLCLLKLYGKWELDKLPDIFGKLVQLKYLGLFGFSLVKSLPPSIGELKRLQTLEVSTSNGLTRCELPRETSKLESLRHLICPVSGNADIGCLSSLRTLKSIKYTRWVAIHKENLVNLRELVIDDIHKVEGKPCILEPFTNFNKLHTLVLIGSSEDDFLPPLDFLSSCENVRTLWLAGKIEMLPSVEKWPTSITMLGLSFTNLDDDSILTLGKLPNLRRLHLIDSHKLTTTKMDFGPNSFPQLHTLKLEFLDNLEKLELGEGAMPNIKRFHVLKCDELVDIPDKLKDILIPDDTIVMDFMNYCYPYRNNM